jgi:predicted KAP-like P-loop ATPase
MVVGISGPWGSGKSSLLNLVEERIHKAAEGKPGILILRFNPWSYATIDQLIAAFFRDLRSKLRLIDRSDLVGKIRTALERVRSLLAPIVNISETWPVGMAYSVATQIWKSRQKAAIKPLVQLLNLLLHPLRHSL